MGVFISLFTVNIAFVETEPACTTEAENQTAYRHEPQVHCPLRTALTVRKPAPNPQLLRAPSKA